MIRDYFSITAWGPTLERGCGEFHLVRADADWVTSQQGSFAFLRGWVCVTVGVLGFCVSLTFWPRGKDSQESEYVLRGREHGEAGE